MQPIYHPAHYYIAVDATAEYLMTRKGYKDFWVALAVSVLVFETRAEVAIRGDDWVFIERFVVDWE